MNDKKEIYLFHKKGNPGSAQSRKRDYFQLNLSFYIFSVF
jgi:hypothetical protein